MFTPLPIIENGDSLRLKYYSKGVMRFKVNHISFIYEGILQFLAVVIWGFTVLHTNDKSMEMYIWFFLYEALIIVLWHPPKFDILYEKDSSITSIYKPGSLKNTK